MTLVALRIDDSVPAPIAARVALYLRVSTGRQAESDLSIPDQRRQMQAHCLGKGWNIAAEYVEPGSSATDDRRPAFQMMIDAAMEKPPAFTVIVVHSFSRFFRDQFQFEFYVRKLGKNGVRLISITQDLGDDPMSVMMRQIMTLFDEYQSKENGKHTLRAMKENARQGFWNGSRPPIGYRAVAAEHRGAKIKKKLEIDPIQAETVRRIYRMALYGIDDSEPMGLKAIATWLNDCDVRTRDGGRFGVAAVHQILTRETYIGRHRFNYRDYRTKAPKPEAEHSIMAVPPIIDADEFHAVQASLKARNPMVMAPRAVSGPSLLTGICFCSLCGGAMTMRTGRGSVGAVYRYYACSTKARQGPTGCAGVAVPMDKLDDAVFDFVRSRLLSSRRIEAMMAPMLERRNDWVERRQAHIAALRERAAKAEAKLGRLYHAVENGALAGHDSSIRRRIAELTAIREQAQFDAARVGGAVERSAPAFTAKDLGALTSNARRKLHNGDGTYAREHLRTLAQRIEVVSKQEIRVLGARDELLRRLAAIGGVKAAQIGFPGSNLKSPVFACEGERYAFTLPL